MSTDNIQIRFEGAEDTMFARLHELAAVHGQAHTQFLKVKKFPNPQVEDIPTSGGYTEYSSAPWWQHGDRYQVTQ